MLTQINIGRMEFDYPKMKGIMDRSFNSVKVPFHKDSSAMDMTKKSREIVWGKKEKNYDYFIADGSGTAISADSSSFDIDLPNGEKEHLPWTLNNYLQVSGVKYASRLRLYCVRKLMSSGKVCSL